MYVYLMLEFSEINLFECLGTSFSNCMHYNAELNFSKRKTLNAMQFKRLGNNEIN